MKSNFRQSMNWLHTWSGFIFGWLLYFIFITGTVGYFENEIDRWMKPEVAVVDHTISQDKVLLVAEQQLQKLAPDSPSWYISFPFSRIPYIQIQWLQLANKEANIPKEWHEKNIDMITNKANDVRETAGGETLYRLHYNLHYVPQVAGYVLTSIATMLMLIGLVTGIVIHKKIFIEFFTFRPKKGLRSWLDIHNIFSVLPLPFHLMITYSGLLLLMGITMSGVIDFTYGEGRVEHRKFYDESRLEIKEQQFIKMSSDNFSLKSVFDDARTRYADKTINYIGLLNRNTENETYEIWFDKFDGIHMASAVTYRIKESRVEVEVSADKVGVAAEIYDLFEHLHEGLFADIYLRWLYFISGLLGAAMVATGMVIWIKKRKKNTEEKKRISIISIIERINVGVIVGLPIAIACYFWSNRLLPITLQNRADWEVHCLFITLLVCIVFASLRSQNMWRNSLCVASIAYLILPIINILSTEHSLITSYKNNDSLMLGFDLSMLFFGGCFAIAAVIMSKKSKKPADKFITTTSGQHAQNILEDTHS